MPHFVGRGIQLLQWLDSLGLNLYVQLILLAFASLVFGAIYMIESVISSEPVSSILIAALGIAVMIKKGSSIQIPVKNVKVV
jgi:hypothetical protein